MSQTPSDCPDLTELREFWDGSSPEFEHRGVAAHIESCAVCRSQVDRWTEGTKAPANELGDDDAPATQMGSTLGEESERIKSGLASSASSVPPTDTQHSLAAETVALPAQGLEPPTTPGGEIMMFDHHPVSERRESLGRLGPYRLLEQIGQGGMGVVLKALDERLNRIVAVKVLARGLADGGSC